MQEVNNLLRQHTQMAKLFKGIGSRLTGGMQPQQRLLAQCKSSKDSEGRSSGADAERAGRAHNAIQIAVFSSRPLDRLSPEAGQKLTF